MIKHCFSFLYRYNDPSLHTVFCGLEFPNPVGLAAGFDKNAELFSELSAFGFGFIEIGTITPLPQPGNDKPRLFRLPADQALINRMGFNNKGVQYAVHQLTKNNKVLIGGNIGKNTSTPNDLALNDYITGFTQLYNYVDYFVVNVSCPNINDLQKLQDISKLGEILEQLVRCRKAHSHYKPILLKISPDLTESYLNELIGLFNRIDINGLVVSNTTRSREGLQTPAEKVEEIGPGGLSGKPLKNRSTEIIRYIRSKAGKAIPIIASGGIMNPSDAIDKIEAGATLVQVYTGFIYSGPSLVKNINRRIATYRKTIAV